MGQNYFGYDQSKTLEDLKKLLDDKRQAGGIPQREPAAMPQTPAPMPEVPAPEAPGIDPALMKELEDQAKMVKPVSMNNDEDLLNLIRTKLAQRQS